MSPATTQDSQATTQDPGGIDPTPAGTEPEQERAWWFLDTLVVEHQLASDVGPVILETTLPAGASPPLHIHHDGDDSWFLLAGRIVVRSGEQVLVAEPGRWVSTPRGVAHTFRVVDDRPARILQVFAEDSFLRLVQAVGGPARELALPAPSGGPGIEVLSRLMAAHDVTTVGASMSEQEAQAVLAGS